MGSSRADNSGSWVVIPAGSRLLELADVQQVVGTFDRSSLAYLWKNSDPRVDQLQKQVEAVAHKAAKLGLSRRRGFADISELADRALGQTPRQFENLLDRAAIPYLTEPWYC